MNTEISRIEVQTISESVDIIDDIEAWLLKQANTYELHWLLAHADDGVIWGVMHDGDLFLSNCLFGPDLRLETLQMARLFGISGELYIWKKDNMWSSWLVIEGEGVKKEYYDEHYLLWGKKVENKKNGFILLRHGEEGLRHAPPVEDEFIVPPLALNIRQYISYDKEGQAYVKFSRLISISSFKKKGSI